MDREILMNKTTKGAIAAAAAGALLLGGIGSLAYWTDSDPVGGGTFTAGSLSLTPLSTCDTWNLDTAEPGGSPFDPAAALHDPRRAPDLHRGHVFSSFVRRRLRSGPYSV